MVGGALLPHEHAQGLKQIGFVCSWVLRSISATKAHKNVGTYNHLIVLQAVR